jgi:hypothetical protein
MVATIQIQNFHFHHFHYYYSHYHVDHLLLLLLVVRLKQVVDDEFLKKLLNVDGVNK